MTELSFTKSVLTLLSAKPPRLSLSHCEDPQKLPARPPYTLPRHLPPPPPPYTTSPSSPGAPNATPGPVPSSSSPALTVSITIKPLRPTPGLDALKLPTATLSSTILTLKAAYSKHTGLDTSRLRLLLKGKPVTDVKTLGELELGDSTDSDPVVLSVMVMGKIDPEELKRNKEAMAKKEAETLKSVPATAPEKTAEDGHVDKKRKVLQDEAFWGELKGFLDGKLKGEEEDAAEVIKVFREAWAKR
ncbi:hypothetical protein EX30DRAFT_338205 [Ascodesmis nigricans]|uniref:Ubiquitin-like domain-containing protein n=1 Tax=Ascodesmis nigricans TaxID=341454 RepID=A0A4S2N318_9PEZI|nr:hypothetical protein EX30DRAFT_338205 [Ascodesmis nigricans]